MKMKDFLRKYYIAFLSYILLFIIFLCFFKYVLIWGSVLSGSMEPTIMTGDITFINGLAYKNHEPQRGDIISFRSREDGKEETMLKRVIGIPGDHLEFINGYVYVNGNILQEDYLDASVKTLAIGTFDVPEDCCFVLGDNRYDSFDSRYWNDPYVQYSDIYGKLLTVLHLGNIL